MPEHESKRKKTGAQRKAKRRARQEAEAELVESYGDHWEGDGNAELVAQSLRWNTTCTADSQGPKTRANLRAMKARELAALVTRRNLLATSQRVANAAVKNLLAMESQNQKDELALIQPENGININIINDLHGTLKDMRNDPATSEAIYDRIASPHRALPSRNGNGSEPG